MGLRTLRGLDNGGGVATARHFFPSCRPPSRRKRPLLRSHCPLKSSQATLKSLPSNARNPYSSEKKPRFRRSRAFRATIRRIASNAREPLSKARDPPVSATERCLRRSEAFAGTRVSVAADAFFRRVRRSGALRRPRESLLRNAMKRRQNGPAEDNQRSRASRVSSLIVTRNDFEPSHNARERRTWGGVQPVHAISSQLRTDATDRLTDENPGSNYNSRSHDR